MYGLKDYTPPVADMRIVDNVGVRTARRTPNRAKMASFHHGVDIVSDTSDSTVDIKNITKGTVVWTGDNGKWGKTVLVENPEGYLVQYGYLGSIGVDVGDQVLAGDKVGEMGESGEAPDKRLGLVVIKDGQSLNPDGTILAPAPSRILTLGGEMKKTQNELNTQAPDADNTTDVSPIDDALFDENPSPIEGNKINLLAGSVGVAVPETQTENALFGAVEEMNLDADLEKVYAEVARAIAGVKDGIASRPILQTNNPLRAELGSIFDRIEV